MERGRQQNDGTLADWLARATLLPDPDSADVVRVCVALLRRQDPPEGHRTRGESGHLIPRKRVAPHSEVIRAIVLEGSPCSEGPASGHRVLGRDQLELDDGRVGTGREDAVAVLKETAHSPR